MIFNIVNNINIIIIIDINFEIDFFKLYYK